MAVSLSGFNQKYRRLAKTILLMIVLSTLQPFLWRYVHARALALQQIRSQGQQITNVQARNDEIQKTLQAQHDFLGQLELVSPPTTAITEVVERVEHLADQVGLTVAITVIQELPANNSVVKEAGIVPVSISVQVAGTPRQLLSFMERVEHTPELSIVPHWTLVPASATSAEYTLTMDIFFFLRRVSDDKN